MQHTQAPAPRYCSYLLRCWQERSLRQSAAAVWRFSLEDPHTGQRRGFATFEALVAFLRQELLDEKPDASRAVAVDEAGDGGAM
jgi:hypothetical protein